MSEQQASGRGAALKAARDAKMEAWFGGGRRWRVMREMSGQPEGSDVTYHEGEFWLPKGKVFRTPFGHKGRHGYLLQEVDQQGADVPGPSWSQDAPAGERFTRVAFGWIVLDNANRDYPGSIIELPPSPYGSKASGPPEPEAEVRYVHDEDFGTGTSGSR